MAMDPHGRGINHRVIHVRLIVPELESQPPWSGESPDSQQALAWSGSASAVIGTMNAFNIPDAKSDLSRLVAAVESGAEAEVIIARNGRPVVRLVPVKPVSTGKRFGVAQGRFIVPDTIDADEEAIVTLVSAA